MHAHCDGYWGYAFADGFKAAGKEAYVLYGGEDRVINGIEHLNWKTVTLGPDDVFLFYSGAHLDEMGDPENLSSAGIKIWYPCYIAQYAGDYWDYIMIENATLIPQIQAQTPHAKILWSLFGCPYDVREVTNPYPDDPNQKNLFYAGRMMQRDEFSHIRMMQFIMKHLPINYHLHIVSACVWMPADCADDRLAQHTACSPLDHDHEPYSVEPTNDYVYLPKQGIIDAVNAYFNDDRIHFLGPMGYGTFDGYIKHADAVIDLGFNCNAPGPNCKIMEPLRYGTPVIADGTSFSFVLIEKYSDGAVVPFRDPYAFSQAIQAQLPIDFERRKEQGELFRDNHSWRQRAIVLIEELEK